MFGATSQRNISGTGFQRRCEMALSLSANPMFHMRLPTAHAGKGRTDDCRQLDGVMPPTLPIAIDIATAGAALAGLLLVFIGAVASAYDSYDSEQQPAVRTMYRQRIWQAFAGFCLSLLATAAG